MIILPAIDIKDGRCVRLVQGDFSTTTQVAHDPLETAETFRKGGAVWLHMVDLDGAVEGTRKNEAIFLNVAAHSGLRVELGGGIRDMKTIEFYLTRGISRVVLGSAALSNPSLVADELHEFGAQLAVGIDAKNRKVATRGWLDTSEMDFLELAKRMEDMGVQTLIYTDISRDGTLKGPSFDQLRELSGEVCCKVIASGGISSIDDVRTLMKQGLYGAICGKSLYAGTLGLGEAVRVGGEQNVG